MTFDSAVSKFLTNKLVLNIVTILSLFNLIGYIVMGNSEKAILFVLLSLIVAMFTKNMIIVLGLPLIIVNLYASKQGSLEGMENNVSNLEEKEEKLINEYLSQVGTDLNSSLNGSSLESGAAGKESFESGRRKNTMNQIDNATLVEDAYDDVNKIAVNGVSGNVKNLVKQQIRLKESMRTMKIKDVF